MIDFPKARLKMVEEQIVSRGIKDAKLIAAVKKIPRHLFVEEALQNQAYSDHPLPIGEKQTISQPYMVALMTEALLLSGKEKVLEIGTGSGYQTAILAELSEKDDLPAPLFYCYIVIFDPFLCEGQFRQFMVVCRKKGLRPKRGMVVKIFSHCPGNTQPIKGAGPPSDLI